MESTPRTLRWEYVAGFVDGEGSLTRNGHGYRVSIPQTDFTVLHAIHTFAGVGNIVHITKRRAHWKESWVYYIARQGDVAMFLRHVLPFLIVKRAAVQRALPRIQRHADTLRVAAIQRERRLQRASALRQHGYTYREIGTMLKIDWGLVRRLLIRAAARAA